MAKAWHIYSTEICEEGIRFVDDGDAQRLVKRSFRLAEIFLRAQPTMRAGGGQQGGSNHRRDDREPDASDSSKEAAPEKPDAEAEESNADAEIIVPTIGEDSLSTADTPDFPES